LIISTVHPFISNKYILDINKLQYFEPGDSGRDKLKRFFTIFSGAFPDAVVNMQHLIAQGDLVIEHIIIHNNCAGYF
jgi:predicted SnoaL-like aldol condensation-catalyzing enzyme